MLISSPFVSRSLARAFAGVLSVSLVAAVSVYAQDTSSAAASDTPATSRPAAPAISLSKQLIAPFDLRVPALQFSDDAAGESSSDRTSVAAEGGLLALSTSPAVPGEGAMQPPPYRRRRYGRPNYNDRWHNGDGSNKLAFVAGGGFTVPAASTGKRLDLNYALKGGAGINFSRKLGALIEFNFDRFGVQGRELDNQFAVYSAALPGVDFSGLDAKSYIWSLTLNPTITLAESENNSLYAVIGGGWYHRVTYFTLPATGQYCDPFYGCYYFQSDQTFDHYANNTGGVNGGIGITHKFSRFSNERFFAEARYVYVFDKKDSTSASSLYPPANFSTSYFPVTVGIRF